MAALAAATGPRAAPLPSPGQPPLPTAADAFGRLMDRCISGAHGRPLVKGSFEYDLAGPDAQAALAAAHAGLRAAFDAFARAGPGRGRLTLRAFVRLLVAAGAARAKSAGGLGLGPNDLLRVLVVGLDAYPLAADPTLLEAELLWPEFVEALARVALHCRPADPDMPQLDDGGGGGLGGDDDEAEAADKVAPAAFGLHHRHQPLHKHLEVLLGRLDWAAAADAAVLPPPTIPRAPRRPLGGLGKSP
jgi:hypothetical protein